MSDWFYVTLAFTVVWAGLALYALALARRVNQARLVEQALRDAIQDRPEGKDGAVCDAPPGP